MAENLHEVTRFGFDHHPETWYEARVATVAIRGPIADEEVFYSVELKFVIAAKIRDGRRCSPEGSIAKIVIVCDERLVPRRPEMQRLLALLVGPLHGPLRIDWKHLTFRQVVLRFGPPIAPRGRNPVLEFRLPPGSDKDHQEGGVEPEQGDPLYPSPRQGQVAETQDLARQGRPTRGANLDELGTLLRGWKEICKTIGWDPKQHRALKRLNGTLEGPIQTFGQGRPPQVFKNELLAWLVNLQQRYDASQQTQKARQLCFKDPLPYGRKGEAVFPELSMHAKKRRSDRQLGSS
jgi:hypothetical protein